MNSILQGVVESIVPLIFLAAMLSVGLSLTPHALKAAALRIRLLAAISALQLVLVPLVGLLTVIVCSVDGIVMSSILLIAACPGGGVTSFYTHIGRGNAALSVAMTAITVALSIVTMPIAFAMYDVVWPGSMPIAMPTVRLVALLLLFIIVPLGIGMLVRFRSVPWAEVFDVYLRNAVLAGIVIAISISVVVKLAFIQGHLLNIVYVSFVFVVLALLCGYMCSKVIGADQLDARAITFEFGIRNLALATTFAVSFLGQFEFAAIAAIYSLVELPILLLIVLKMRSAR